MKTWLIPYKFSRSHRLIRNTDVISYFSAPVLTANPASDVFEVGESVTLTCSYVSPQDVTMYYFYRNDALVVSGYNADYQMVKRDLLTKDSGNYTCACGIGRSKTPMSNVVSFTVVGKLTIIRGY